MSRVEQNYETLTAQYHRSTPAFLYGQSPHVTFSCRLAILDACFLEPMTASSQVLVVETVSSAVQLITIGLIGRSH